MSMNFNDWCARWGVPPAAAAELGAVVDLPAQISETSATARIRLDASADGVTLFRNNSGVMFPQGGGRPVRFGLGNESPVFNRLMKSSDLIGIGPYGHFTAVEVKKPGWRWRGTEREEAQANFIRAVIVRGGQACFATSWAEAKKEMGL